MERRFAGSRFSDYQLELADLAVASRTVPGLAPTDYFWTWGKRLILDHSPTSWERASWCGTSRLQVLRVALEKGYRTGKASGIILTEASSLGYFADGTSQMCSAAAASTARRVNGIGWYPPLAHSSIRSS